MKPRPYYLKQARMILKNAREDKGITYAQLSELLRDHGESIDTRVLINKINRGSFTLQFALQCLAAMEVTSVKLPNYLHARKNAEPDGRLTQNINNPLFEWPETADEDD